MGKTGRYFVRQILAWDDDIVAAIILYIFYTPDSDTDDGSAVRIISAALDTAMEKKIAYIVSCFVDSCNTDRLSNHSLMCGVSACLADYGNSVSCRDEILPQTGNHSRDFCNQRSLLCLF